ncbi:FdhF/YdeP family oxidoreductase [Amorphus sp. MBR-141]
MSEHPKIEPYSGPAGGWGSMRSLARHAVHEHALPGALSAVARQNKPDGFACVSCAWAKPAKPGLAEFCENGAKATFWELTRDRATPAFFAEHTVSELRNWRDYDLEMAGRLTQPMRYDADSDRYVEVSWERAFAEIGAELTALRAEDPRSVVFYASGRASLETSYMYALLARMYGNNNLPDSSNMCHESTSVALPQSIGVPVGTVTLEHFDKTDGIFFFGQNVGVSSPRMLHQLQAVRERDGTIVTFNPLRERGLERFTNPQDPVMMLTGGETEISQEYYQVRPGGDISAIAGMCKWLLAEDARAAAEGRPRILDTEFIAAHTHGFEAFAAFVQAQDWAELERESGLSRDEMEAAARRYAACEAVIGVYGMGLTQHKLGVDSVQMLVNLLLLRGNIGKPGAGICPVRGHSNVQGQRTVGITEKPALAPLDKLKDLYGFEPPREKGVTTVEACEGIVDGSVKAFFGLGGNFVRAIPERDLMEERWQDLRLTVQIATKLNRSHLINGKVAYLLPCLGRLEHDEQATGRQVVTVEDSTSCIHASTSVHDPASPHLLSEARIVAEIAKASLPPNPNVPWDDWASDHALVRDAIERTYPEKFERFNERMFTPGGFRKPIPADERKWNTDTGKANFKLPRALHASFDDGADPDVLRLITLRSNDQFNTTIYGYRDRFRGIEGTRMVVMMNPADIARFGLADGEEIGLVSAADDGMARRVDGFRVVAYEVPKGAIGAYYPECNPLIPLWQHALESQVPAAKSVPVRIVRDASAAVAAA